MNAKKALSRDLYFLKWLKRKLYIQKQCILGRQSAFFC